MVGGQQDSSFSSMARPSSDKTRTRTLTGCSSCRLRKLKCDNRKPACRRCVTLGIACQGYEAKFSWLPYKQDKHAASAFDSEHEQARFSFQGEKHSPKEPHIRRRPLFTDPERIDMVNQIQESFLHGDQDKNVDRAINDLESVGAELCHDSQLGHDIGPFSVFTLYLSKKCDVVEPEVFELSEGDLPCSIRESDETSPDTVLESFEVDETHPGSIETFAPPWLEEPDETAMPWLEASSQDMRSMMTSLPLPSASPALVEPIGNGDFPSTVSAMTSIAHGIETMPGFLFPLYSTQLPPTRCSSGGNTQNKLAPEMPQQPMWPDFQSLVQIPRSLSESENISRIPTDARFLLEYYSTQVVDYMCHLPNPQSPWRTIHLPCAMSTMADLFVFGCTNSARMALFYALLSISAYHLGSKIPWTSQVEKYSCDGTNASTSYNIPDHNDSHETRNYWMSKGSTFQDMATAQIRTCFQVQETDLGDPEVYRELLMSLLSMVTISVTSGKLNSAHIYLHQAKKLIDMYNQQQARSSSFKSAKVAALHQIYSYLHVIFNSTQVSKSEKRPEQGLVSLVRSRSDLKQRKSTPRLSRPPSPSVSQMSLDALAQGQDEYKLFARIYGVPRSLVTLIARASNAAKDLEEDVSTITSGSSADLVSSPLQSLEDEICNWCPTEDEMSSAQHSSAYDPQIGSHLVQAMHDALIVMFFRRVQPINRVVLQHYVESAVDHLNTQEEVKIREGINAAALLWPWFMVAAEAISEPVREKLRFWASLARQYGGRNLEVAEQVIKEVWRRHDRQLPNATWVDVVREWHVTLVLT